MRRSDSAPISAMASARLSAANATGSAWKLPPDSISLVVGENERIVRDGVRLGQQHIGGIAHLVQARAHHLRLAAEAVRILHARAILVRFPDRAAREKVAVDRRGVDLPAMAAHLVDSSVERRVAAEAGVDGQRARDEGRGCRAFRREEPGKRERGRHLRSVEKRQSFLRSQHDRLQPGLRKCVARRHRAAGKSGLTLADQCAGEMRERREIPRRAHRSLRRDARNDARIRHRDQRFDHAPAHARVPPRERGCLQREHEAYDAFVERRARPGRMRQHERALQLREPRVVDSRTREEPEPGIDAVDGVARRDDPRDRFRRTIDGGLGRGVEGQCRRRRPQPAKVGQSERAGAQRESGHDRTGRRTSVALCPSLRPVRHAHRDAARHRLIIRRCPRRSPVLTRRCRRTRR